MKKLLIILLFPLSTVGQKVGFAVSIGYSQTPISKFDFNYRLNNHILTSTIQPNFTSQTKYSQLTAAITYGYLISTWQPYVGYSNNGLTYGINRYIGSTIIGAGMQGKNPVISIGITSLRVNGKELFTGNDYAIAGLQLISGFSMGLHESIQASHWGKGNQFWDNQISWKNKYKDFDNGDKRAKFIGSKTVFVGFTDGYHLTNLISNTANIATLSFAIGSKEGRNWKVIAKKVLISVAANRAAYYVSYNHIFK